MRIVFEDRWIVVVDKPHGLPSQAPRHGGPHVVQHLTDAGRDYVALHHRLDTPASGLLVVATHPEANAGLARQFQTHAIQRRYVAVLVGEVAAATWTKPVGGRPAHTEVTPRSACVDGVTACDLVPHTGRKHQLRIHAALAGHPICGDRRHGGEAGRRWPRLALHAAHLGLDHPVTGDPMAWSSAVPDDLRGLWETTRPVRREG